MINGPDIDVRARKVSLCVAIPCLYAREHLIALYILCDMINIDTFKVIADM